MPSLIHREPKRRIPRYKGASGGPPGAVLSGKNRTR
jgi:hypothetical protein